MEYRYFIDTSSVILPTLLVLKFISYQYKYRQVSFYIFFF
jgi:hypothetical protein